MVFVECCISKLWKWRRGLTRRACLSLSRFRVRGLDQSVDVSRFICHLVTFNASRHARSDFSRTNSDSLYPTNIVTILLHYLFSLALCERSFVSLWRNMYEYEYAFNANVLIVFIAVWVILLNIQQSEYWVESLSWPHYGGNVDTHVGI